MSRLPGQHGFTLIEVMTVTALLVVLAVFSLPITSRAVADVRLRGDARSVANTVSLAKMRATSAFSRARVFADLSTNTFLMQVWDRTDNQWVTEGGSINLSPGVGFGFGTIDTPPPDTQPEMSQSPLCTDDAGVEIANTACVVFNSRGIPIDDAGAPYGANALYITDGVGVFGTTLTATPLINLWWSPSGGANWVKQ
ncbi:MAG: Tfp pilus assembly protein FimT/FimU [Vicinamibacterales bacterium]